MGEIALSTASCYLPNPAWPWAVRGVAMLMGLLMTFGVAAWLCVATAVIRCSAQSFATLVPVPVALTPRVLQCSMSEMDASVEMGLCAGFMYIIASSLALAKLMSDLAELENTVSVRLKQCACLNRV